MKRAVLFAVLACAAFAVQANEPRTLNFVATYDAAAIADGDTLSPQTTAAAGAEVGDTCAVSISEASSLIARCIVYAANRVRVLLTNMSGGEIDLGSAVYRIQIHKQSQSAKTVTLSTPI